MSINIELHENFDGSLDGRYKQGNKPAPSSGGTPALAWSAPQGLSDGNTITITTDGTYNFGTKANAKPMYFWDANEGSLNSSSLSRRAFTIANGSITTGTTVINSTQALQVDVTTAGVLEAEGPFVTDLDGGGDDIVVFCKRRTNFNGLDAYTENTAWNMKLWRWWKAVGDNNVVVGLGQANTQQGNPRVAFERTGTTTYTGNVNFFGLNDTANITEFLRLGTGTSGNADARFNWIANGYEYEVYGTARDVSYPGKYTQFYWPQAGGIPHPSLGWAAFYDCFYLDDTQHAVILTDRPTWVTDGSASIEVAIPTAWSTNSVSVTVRAGAFSDLSGKYLYLFDGTGEPITTVGVAL